MKKDLRPSWKQLVNIKNKIGRVNILLLQIYILLQIDKSGNETHLIINTTKNIIKSKLEYIMIPNDVLSLELLGSVFKTKLTNCRTWQVWKIYDLPMKN